MCYFLALPSTAWGLNSGVILLVVYTMGPQIRAHSDLQAVIILLALTNTAHTFLFSPQKIKNTQREPTQALQALVVGPTDTTHC